MTWRLVRTLVLGAVLLALLATLVAVGPPLLIFAALSLRAHYWRGVFLALPLLLLGAVVWAWRGLRRPWGPRDGVLGAPTMGP